MWKSTAEVSLSQLSAATLYTIEPIKTFPKHCIVKNGVQQNDYTPRQFVNVNLSFDLNVNVNGNGNGNGNVLYDDMMTV